MSVWGVLVGASLVALLLAFEGLTRVNSSAIVVIRLLMLVLLLSVLLVFLFRRQWVLNNYVPFVGGASSLFLLGILGQIIVPGVLAPNAGFDVVPASLLAIFVLYAFLRLPVVLSASIGLAFSVGVALILGELGQGPSFYRSVLYLIFCNFMGVVLLLEIRAHEQIIWIDRVRAVEAETVARSQVADCSSALEMRMALVAGINHDLAQPTLALDTSLSLALAKLDRGDLAGGRLSLNAARDSMVYLRESLGHLLSVAHAERGKSPVQLEAVDVCELLSRLAGQFIFDGNGDGYEIGKKFPSFQCLVLSDSRYLNQVFANIIGNAVKFSKDRAAGSGRVVIRVRTDGGMCKIDVLDNGPGIAEEDREKVWQLYGRGTLGSSAQGMGLGLSLVKHAIAQLPGHEVLVKSRPRRGTRFRVIVPLFVPELDNQSTVSEGMPQRSGSDKLVFVISGRYSDFGDRVCEILSVFGLEAVTIESDRFFADMANLEKLVDGDVQVGGMVYCDDIERLCNSLFNEATQAAVYGRFLPLVIATRCSSDQRREVEEKLAAVPIRWLSPNFAPVDLVKALSDRVV